MIRLKNQEELTFDDILLLPEKSKIPFENDYQLNTSALFTKNIHLKIPVVSAPMATVTEWEMATLMAKMGGIGIIHPFMEKIDQCFQVNKVKQISKDLLVGVTIYDGWKDLHIHIKNLLKEGVDVFVLDTYHAFNIRTLKTIREIKKMFPKLELVVGNVVTKEAVEALCRAGADAIKVGIGPGSHCTTRLVTGYGRPQLSSIWQCAQIAKKFSVPIIADGGIRYSGDLVKALAFEANTVMIGGLLAGCDQSPGKTVFNNGKMYKKSSGSCTKEVVFKKEKIINKDYVKKFKSLIRQIFVKKDVVINTEETNFFEEGVGGLVEYKGDAEKIITDLANGLKRGMWYGGANNIMELQKNAKFVKITSEGYNEAQPRGIKKIID